MANTITAGSINRTGVGFLVVDGLSKTNTAITIGSVVCSVIADDGWRPTLAADVAPYGVMVSPSVAAVAATQHDIRVLVRGNVTVNKVSGNALRQGQGAFTSATGGSVDDSTGSGVFVGLVTTDAAALAVVAEILI